MKKALIVLTILTVSIFAFTACSAEKEAPAVVEAPAVSDGSEDLVIDYLVNLAGSDEENFFPLER